MKSLGMGLLHLALLAALAACGKDNESGKKRSAWEYANPYGTQNYPALGTINSPYSYGNIPVNTVLAENPCMGGFGGMQGYPNQSYAGQRMPIQIPLTGFPSVVAPNDIYVGVTSFGDVAVIAGQAAGQPPLFVGYMCPRSFAPSGSGQLLGIQIGAYTNCLFKPITAARILFPGGSTAEFRWLEGGSSMRQKFSFCK